MAPLGRWVFDIIGDVRGVASSSLCSLCPRGLLTTSHPLPAWWQPVARHADFAP